MQKIGRESLDCCNLCQPAIYLVIFMRKPGLVFQKYADTLIISHKGDICRTATIWEIIILRIMTCFFMMFPIPLQMTSVIWNSLAVQWLGLCGLTAKGRGSVPSRGTKIPRGAQCGRKKKKDKYFRFCVFFFFLNWKKSLLDAKGQAHIVCQPTFFFFLSLSTSCTYQHFISSLTAVKLRG